MMAEARSAYQQDRKADAARLCARVLKSAPNTVETLHLLGVIKAQGGNLVEAEPLLERAAGLAPGNAGVWIALANLLREQGRHDEALARFSHVIGLGPVQASVLIERARLLEHMGRLEDALADYTVLEGLAPGSPDVPFHRGRLLWNLQRRDEALAAFEAVLEIKPDSLGSLANIATILAEQGRQDEALVYCDRAIAAHPDAGTAHMQRGFLLSALNRHEEAVASYDRVLADQPDEPIARVSRGTSLRHLNRSKAALADFDRVLSIDPFDREALSNRAGLLRDLDRNNEAAQTYRRLRDHHPDYPRVEGHLLNASLLSCDWSDLEALSASIVAGVRAGVATDTPFAFMAHSTSPQDQLDCASAWMRERHPPVSPAVWTGERYRHDRIRLAYLSADFKNHPTSHLMARLFETHDRDRFELTAVSFGVNTGDPTRERLERTFDRFIDMRSCSDREIAEQVRALEIDISVNCQGFTRDARTRVFAMRSAPVQVNYLVYPGTMGAPYMDYLVADPILIPETEERFYTEKIVRLPDTYQATDDRRPIGETPTRAECSLPETGFVFCSFNNNYKILPPVFDIWMRLLSRVEGSVLWLYVKSPDAIENLRREAAARGVDPSRLVFARHMEMSAHLARHRLADLLLDTFPYNSHTTASDALWAELPIVTCAGRTFASRVAASLLSAVGLPELITEDFAAYEALALELALKPERLAAVRARLAEQRTRWPLFDSERFRRHLESAYVTMHERQQQGLPPEAFAIQPISPGPERHRAEP